MTVAATPEAAKPEAWRTPAMIVLSGCLIALLSFGPRSAAGQFLTPLSFANGWGRDRGEVVTQADLPRFPACIRQMAGLA